MAKSKYMKKRNPIAQMMQTNDGRRLFGERTERAEKGRGSYSRRIKHKNKEFDF